MVEESKSAGESAAPRSNHPIFTRLYPLLATEGETVFTTFEECQEFNELLDRTLQEHSEDLDELKNIKTANYIASMCIKAGKFDRSLSFFQKAQTLWGQFDESERALPSREVYSRLPKLPYSHLQFNFGNYYMNFKQAMEAADLFYRGLETSPFRYCAQRQPSEIAATTATVTQPNEENKEEAKE